MARPWTSLAGRLRRGARRGAALPLGALFLTVAVVVVLAAWERRQDELRLVEIDRERGRIWAMTCTAVHRAVQSGRVAAAGVVTPAQLKGWSLLPAGLGTVGRAGGTVAAAAYGAVMVDSVPMAVCSLSGPELSFRAPALLAGAVMGGLDRVGAVGGEATAMHGRLGAVQAFREAIEADDAARKRRSEKEGDSFAPTFHKPTRPAGPAVRVGPPVAEIPAVPAVETGPAAPAERPPETVEPPPEAGPDRDEPGRAARPAAQYRERLPERGSEGEAASSPLDALLEVLNEPPGKAAWLEYAREEPAEDGRAGPGERRAAPVLPAALAGLQVGKGLYARTLYEANSDWPGPVVLEILEPPLAGAVATGAFQEAGERLVIRIDRFSLGRQSWEIEGWAVDPGCACYGIPGEVDRHWFERVLLPSALAFAGGFLDAAARTAQIVTRDAAGNSITVESGAPSHRQQVYAGAAEAARRAGAVLLESVPDGPTVRVPRNTELVLVVTATPEPEGRAGGAARTRGAAPAPAGEAPGRGGPVAVIDAGGAGSLPGGGRAQ